ncbi:MAG: hypothetical protein PUD76_00785, partial [Clostridia bacterium]|nr:hypothetical protein [Clostridia bacterium]
KLYNLLGHGLLSPFRMVVSQLHSTRDLQTMSLYLCIFQFAQFIVPYQGAGPASRRASVPSRRCPLSDSLGALTVPVAVRL